MDQIKDQNNTQFFLRLLKKADLEEILRLCDACVGENLYTKEDFLTAIELPEHFFYVLTTKENEIAGYVYYLYTDLESIASYTKLEVDLFYNASQKEISKVAKIQSVAVKDSYRGTGLSAALIEFALKNLSKSGMELVVGVCWKMGEVIPMKNTLLKFEFKYLSEAKKIWYDDTDLVCPYCKGRCSCDAEVYVRILQ